MWSSNVAHTNYPISCPNLITRSNVFVCVCAQVDAPVASSPVGRLADFALLQTPVAQMLRGAQLPAVAAQAAREVDLVVEGRGWDGGRHRPQAVQCLQQRDGLEAGRDRVGALRRDGGGPVIRTQLRIH